MRARSALAVAATVVAAGAVCGVIAGVLLSEAHLTRSEPAFNRAVRRAARP